MSNPETTRLTGRLMAVDFGLKRVGLAVSDPENRLAVGAGRFDAASPATLLARILSEAKDRCIEGFVIGRPSATRGNEAVISGVEQLANGLENNGFLVTTWNEGYTTASALSDRKRIGGRGGRDKGWADEAAAIILLQDYLAWVRGHNG